MYLLHEPVEMRPLSGSERQAVVEQVHEMGLASTHAAPEVEPAHGISPAAAVTPQRGNYAAQGAWLFALGQPAPEVLQFEDRFLLRKIMYEARPLELRPVAFERACGHEGGPT